MDLFDAMRLRRTHRGELLPTPISESHLAQLIEAAMWSPSPFNVQPWELILIRQASTKQALARLTAESIQEQFCDAGFLEANSRWMRLTEEEWEAAGDGVLLSDHVQLPPFLSHLDRLRPLLEHAGRFAFLGKLGVGKLPARKFARWVREAPLLMLVLMDWHRQCPGESGRDWMLLGLGAMIQNLLLAATALGIGTQFISAPLESPAGREAIRTLVQAPDHLEPFSLLRLGYIEPSATRMQRRRDFVHHESWKDTTDATD